MLGYAHTIRFSARKLDVAPSIAVHPRCPPPSLATFALDILNPLASWVVLHPRTLPLHLCPRSREFVVNPTAMVLRKSLRVLHTITAHKHEREREHLSVESFAPGG